MTKSDLVLHGVAYMAAFFNHSSDNMDQSMIDVDTTNMIKSAVIVAIDELEQEKKLPYDKMVFDLEMALHNEISYWREGEE